MEASNGWRIFDKEFTKRAGIMISLLMYLFVMLQATTTIAVDTALWNVLAGVTEKEMAEHRDIGQKAEQFLLSGKFEELESMATKYRTSKEMFSDGEWKLSVFYDGMSYYLRSASEDSWKSRLGKLKLWVQNKPKSVTAHVALAECLVGYAFFGRSHGWAKDVSEEQWKLFNERLDEATRVLLEVKEAGPSCPGWLSAFQRIAVADWSRKEYENLFEKAVASEPQYNMYYFRKAWQLMPRWFGKPGEWEEFASAAADRVGGVQGDILYARIVWFMDRRGPYKNLVEKPQSIAWDRVERGLQAIRTSNGSKPQ